MKRVVLCADVTVIHTSLCVGLTTLTTCLHVMLVVSHRKMRYVPPYLCCPVGWVGRQMKFCLRTELKGEVLSVFLTLVNKSVHLT